MLPSLVTPDIFKLPPMLASELSQMARCVLPLNSALPVTSSFAFVPKLISDVSTYSLSLSAVRLPFTLIDPLL